jgi:alkylation response protein AidB-like acyl-CoA dehydrogenase
VWAANPPVDRVRAEPDGSVPEGWVLSGTKPWCSGAGSADRALVTAEAPDGYRLFVADLSAPGVWVVPGSWPAPAMRGSDSRSVELTRHPATPVGGPGAYLERSGFWPGAVGVAAVWLGGAQAVAARLAATNARRPLDQHGLAHTGAVDAALVAAESVLSWAGDAIDADPDDSAGLAHLVAARARAVVEATVTEVVDRVGRALGAGPLAQDVRHGQRVADLGLYVRQSHAERDLEELGRLALDEGGRTW